MQSDAQRAVAKGMKIIACVFFAGMAICGLVLLYLGVGRSLMAIDSASWPGVPGVVTKVGIRTSSVGRRAPTPVFAPGIRYTYIVDGVEYQGGGFRLSDPFLDDRSRAERIIARHPVGSKVTVYYRPGDPRTSVLLRDTTHASNHIFALFGLIFTLLPGGGVYFIIQSLRRGPALATASQETAPVASATGRGGTPE